MKPLPKKYNHKETEKRWQEAWFSSDVYHWKDDMPREETFVIDTPPPTVSGHLHMGHVFSYTQCDFIARYQRMAGKDVFYPMGFDDNGLPTERLVEKDKKKKAHQYESREAFIEDCIEVSDNAREAYRNLFKSTALSVDWRQEYHTISEDARRISQASFVDLFEKGLVERRMEPMLWDPVDQTAIAQAEVEDKELESSFNDIRFAVADSDETFVIGTTRPELIPACVGIFYHPEDERYQHLKGKEAVTPLFGVHVPILEDDTVEMEKGTGIMMCCTFGDEADIEKWRKHKLPLRVVLNKYGKMDFITMEIGDGGKLTGQDNIISFVSGGDLQYSDKAHYHANLAAENTVDIHSTINLFQKIRNKKASNKDPKHLGARETILQLLQESGDLIKLEKITHAVKCAERSGAPLEILPSPQWFIKIIDKKDALKARSTACNWRPEWMQLRMEQWIDGLNWDWCISRQRYYGVPFPVWYVQESGIGNQESRKVVVANTALLPVNPLTDTPQGYSIIEKLRDGHWRATEDATGNEVEIIGDADVMDTWATSSLTPQISAGGIGREGINKLFPADLRPQAHEIIRTWAFYTLAKAHLHNDSLPWHNLMISGWCLAEDKTKMSKSKGNVVTPVELIEEKGTDAVRYWAATSRLGQDTAFSTDLLKIGNKLVTKLWNATKFAAIHLDKLPPTDSPASRPSNLRSPLPRGEREERNAESGARRVGGNITESLDRWILTRLHKTITKSTDAFKRYEYADALRATEDFFWNDFCDNYLELVKKRVYDEVGSNPSGQLSAAATIHHCLQGILRLFAPFVPHITEELFSHIFEEDFAAAGSLHARGMWPNAEDYLCDEAAEKSGIAAIEILEAIRKAKSEKGVSIKYPIDQLTLTFNAGDATESEGRVTPILDDLKAAGNVGRIIFTSQPPSSHDTTLTSSDEKYTLALTFAKEAEEMAANH